MKKVKELLDLIEIYNFCQASINNFNVSKDKIKQLSSVATLLNKKIVEEILSDDFIVAISASDNKKEAKDKMDEAMKEVIITRDIKAGQNPGKSFAVIKNGQPTIVSTNETDKSTVSE